MLNISKNQRNTIISIISKAIEKERKIIFAYLYGSFATESVISNDIFILKKLKILLPFKLI